MSETMKRLLEYTACGAGPPCECWEYHPDENGICQGVGGYPCGHDVKWHGGQDATKRKLREAARMRARGS